MFALDGQTYTQNAQLNTKYQKFFLPERAASKTIFCTV